MDYPNNESDIDIKEEPGENAVEIIPDFTLSEQNEVDGISYHLIKSLAHVILKITFFIKEEIIFIDLGTVAEAYFGLLVLNLIIRMIRASYN